MKNYMKWVALGMVAVLLLVYVGIPMYEDWKGRGEDTTSIVSITDPVVICNAQRSQSNPKIHGDFVVWKDYRNGNEDVYGYNITTQREYSIAQTIERERLIYNGKQIGYGHIIYTKTVNGTSALDLYVFHSGDYGALKIEGFDSKAVWTSTIVEEHIIFTYWYSSLNQTIYFYDLDTRIVTNKTLQVQYENISTIAGTNILDARDEIVVFRQVCFPTPMTNYVIYNLQTDWHRHMGYNRPYLVDVDNVVFVKDTRIMWHSISTGTDSTLCEVGENVVILDVSTQFIVGTYRDSGTSYNYRLFIYDLMNEEFVDLDNKVEDSPVSIDACIYDNRVVYSHSEDYVDDYDIYMLTLIIPEENGEPIEEGRVDRVVEKIVETVKSNFEWVIFIAAVVIITLYIEAKHYDWEHFKWARRRK